MPQIECPDRATLERLLLGLLTGEAAESHEEHLLHCDVCSRTAETLAPRDDLTASLAPGAADESNEDPALGSIIERGKRLQAELDTLPSVETLLYDDEGRTSRRGETPRVDFDPAEIDFLAPAEEPDELGRLGGNAVQEVIGVGGMGIVFRAVDPKLKRQVALKAMKPVIAASRSARNRFLREAEATAAIEHDHIVTIYEVGEDRGIPIIAMRYLHGESLQTRLAREGRLDEREVLRIGRQIALGLAAAHDRGLIHRDVKPDNVWLDSKQGTEPSQGRVKIVDFGLVRSVHDASGLTQSGMVVGTPRYMAPEQAEGTASDHRCDLFSLGSVLYHLVTGRPPFEGATLTSTLLAVVRAEPDPIGMHRPETHPDLATLIRRLLAKNAADRPATGTEVASELAAIERQLDEGTTASYAAVEPRTAADGGRRGLGRHARLWIGALAALLMVAGVIYVQSNRGRWRIDTSGDGVQVATTDGGRSVKVTDTTTGTSVSATRDGNTTIVSKGDRNEVTLDDDGFTVTRDGEEIADVQVQMMHATQGDPYARDRAAAEWVLSVGGSVVIADRTSPHRSIRSELPPGPVTLLSVSLHRVGNVEFSAENLQLFAGLGRLETAHFEASSLDAAGLAVLAESSRIRRLSLQNTSLESTDLALLRSLDPFHLQCSGGQVVDDWRFVTELPSLREIEIHGSEVPSLDELAGHPQLTRLTLVSVRTLAPPILERLQRANPQLRILVGRRPAMRVLGHDPLSEAIERCLEEKWVLSGLTFNQQNWSSDRVPKVVPDVVGAVRIPRGRELSQDDAQLIRSLGPSFWLLDASGCTGTDDLARGLAGLVMTTWTVPQSDLTDAGLRALGDIGMLANLDVTGTRVTREGVEAFRRDHPYCAVNSNFGKVPADPTLGWSRDTQPSVDEAEPGSTD